ncbi:DNA repair REX1-B-domain-containing protein [Spinellus fusiger]|nr:DNA repair REX1-B-domain-containing protein [Spinellus fusiger]
MTETALVQGCQSLSKAHATRLALYKEFNDAYKDYLQDTCPPEQYHSICRIVTEGFQEVSHDIQTIEQVMTEKGHTILSELIRHWQTVEKEKLKETATLQILTIQARQGDKDYDTTIEEKHTRLQELQGTLDYIWNDIREEIANITQE